MCESISSRNPIGQTSRMVRGIASTRDGDKNQAELGISSALMVSLPRIWGDRSTDWFSRQVNYTLSYHQDLIGLMINVKLDCHCFFQISGPHLLARQTVRDPGLPESRHDERDHERF
jgi:hypothetical protein